MLRFRSQRKGSESGYSLIELLVVTMILMVLSLFSVPIYDQINDRARLTATMQDLRVIEQALEAYRAEFGHYPTRLGHLTKYGYMRTDFAFESPWSSRKVRYYFYAIDDDKEPQAFALGDPGPNADCSRKKFYASNQTQIPCGKKPGSQAWIFAGSKTNLTLIDEKGDPVQRSSLSGFRVTCDPRLEKNMRIAPGCVVKTES